MEAFPGFFASGFVHSNETPRCGEWEEIHPEVEDGLENSFFHEEYEDNGC